MLANTLLSTRTASSATGHGEATHLDVSSVQIQELFRRDEVFAQIRINVDLPPRVGAGFSAYVVEGKAHSTNGHMRVTNSDPNQGILSSPAPPRRSYFHQRDRKPIFPPYTHGIMSLKAIQDLPRDPHRPTLRLCLPAHIGAEHHSSDSPSISRGPSIRRGTHWTPATWRSIARSMQNMICLTCRNVDGISFFAVQVYRMGWARRVYPTITILPDSN